MECEYCKKVLKNKHTLKSHQQTAKYCLKIQGGKSEDTHHHEQEFESGDDEEPKDTGEQESESESEIGDASKRESDAKYSDDVTVLRERIETLEMENKRNEMLSKLYRIQMSQLEERLNNIYYEGLDILKLRLNSITRQMCNMRDEYVKETENEDSEDKLYDDLKKLHHVYSLSNAHWLIQQAKESDPIVKGYKYLRKFKRTPQNRISDDNILAVAEKCKEGVEGLATAAFNHILKNRYVDVEVGAV